ncbi:NAD(P)-binding protein [Lophiostoma macrostomum CBS 122681]|uniref:NAD(P)-binding protein n=1 Tax=Lophiostoma macrostomum CBS 122681 TaxID=1314788 RepID=A0A6A6T480_9PLEO|nr:NAD(P)-binding protein [Lophiostoma macrostomum CBS 122681]
MARVFLTGATGYLGGDALHRLSASKGPKLSVSCLVRDATKAQDVAKAYPSVRIVQGDLDDTHLIETEARNSDIVIHLAATAHLASSKAIAKGLAEGDRESVGHWLQISGATLLATKEIAEGRFGFKDDKVYDDVKDIQKVHSIIKNNTQRAVDLLVVSQDPLKVKTALLVGPHIYGTGRGPTNTRSIQAPEYARATLKLKEGFRLGEGENSWSTIHVQDLSDLTASLVDAAAEEKSGLWNEDGIYFPENGDMEFGELGARIAAEAHKQGLIPKSSVKKVIDAKEADSLSGHASILWGTNAVIKSSRAGSLLEWKPYHPSLRDEIPAIVRREAKTQRAKSEL